MDQLTDKLSENQKKLDELLGVGRNYDVISRDLYIGQWKGRLYVIDGYGDGSFRPHSPITRGQMAKILYTLM